MVNTGAEYEHDEHGTVEVLEVTEEIVVFESKTEFVDPAQTVPKTWEDPLDYFELYASPVDYTIDASSESINTQ